MMSPNEIRKNKREDYNANRFFIIMYVRNDGSHSTVNNIGTSSFEHVWAMGKIGDQFVLKTTTDKYLVTAHDDAIGAIEESEVRIGSYLTFNDKHSAIMAATMRATRG